MESGARRHGRPKKTKTFPPRKKIRLAEPDDRHNDEARLADDGHKARLADDRRETSTELPNMGANGEPPRGASGNT
ncbi:hypothetical protein KP79_PYT22807 [Mizuhopecten yessoensis]|uniref:Uncharacterized protein n=1 Tax=Mizuhopecten yessoensis TaxID=6573 RepID=A0A210Q6L7_MIZYE|nr:hypothetical protein KP79_PYT22807 [Mizuhopecten yessoensis]